MPNSPRTTRSQQGLEAQQGPKAQQTRRAHPARTVSPSKCSSTIALVAGALIAAVPGVAWAQPAAPPVAAPPAAAPPAAAPPAAGPAGQAAPPAAGAAATAAPASPPAGDAPLIPPSAPIAPPPAAPAPPAAATAAPATQAAATERQVEVKPRETSGTGVGDRPGDVYAEEWWSTARPTFEIHGYYRLRAELFQHFALGRRDAPANEIFPNPADKEFIDINNNPRRVTLCGDDPKALEACDDNTNAGANMRFRLNPELHISDNVRVMSQIDLLDNLVLGSTPEGYNNQPGTNGGYSVRERGGYAPTGAFATTQWAPSAGQNSQQDSIVVKRVWGEYTTPIGLLRFGRMPSQWGLGMLANDGNGYDSDNGSTADRLLFVTGIKPWDLYFGAFWDFANEGSTSASGNNQQGQAYDLAQGDDVDQWGLIVVRRRNPDLQRLELARGDVVLNGGLYAVYRAQNLANDSASESAALGSNAAALSTGYVRRGAEAVIPDFWFQLLYEKFRFEAEAALIWGSMENTERTAGTSNYDNPLDPNNPGWDIHQFGLTTQAEIRALEDKLRVQFGFGYATGDQDVEGLQPPSQGLQPQLTSDRNFSTFRMHPDYRVDLILWRHIYERIQGGYYFRPSVDYDFIREKNGQKLGGGAAVIWSRASEFVQTPGNSRDLGIELNFKLYFQAKDGSLNDDPDKMGGFFTSFEYGVLFPLGGLGYLPGQEETFVNNKNEYEGETPQTLRWYLGIMF